MVNYYDKDISPAQHTFKIGSHSPILKLLGQALQKKWREI